MNKDKNEFNEKIYSQLGRVVRRTTKQAREQFKDDSG